MICLICRQAHLDHGFTSVVFERDGMKLFVKDIPSLVCSGCGEAYVNATIAARLLQLAKQTVELGLKGADYRFGENENTFK